MNETSKPEPTAFEKAAQIKRESGTVLELLGYLKQNKKWILLPVIVVLLLLAILVMAGGSAAAPFIYTLF